MIAYIVFWISYIFLNIDYPKLDLQLKKILKTISIILFIILLGTRKDVGKDYQNYVSYFENIQTSAFLEPGYDFLNLFISNLGLDVSMVFLIMAILSSLFIFLSFTKNNEFKFLPTSLLIVIFGFLFLSNGVRQGLAVSIFFFSYRYIKSQQLLYFLCCIAFASLFHLSALILIPIYFFGNKTLPSWLYLLVYLLSIITIFWFDNISIMKFNILGYIDHYDDETLLTSTTLSLGNISVLLFNSFVFIMSLYKKGYKTNPLIFNIFLLYAITFNMQMSMALLTRVSIYFAWFSFAWVPILYYHYKNHLSRNNITILRTLIIIFYLTMAINAYYNFDPYKSVWF